MVRGWSVLVAAVVTLLSSECHGFDLMWSRAADMPEARNSAVAVGVDDSVYVIGGLSGSRNSYVALNTALRYDVPTGSWTQIAPMTYPRVGHAVAAVSGTIYVMGGDEDAGVHTKFEAYDTLTGTWSVKPDLATGREGAAACAIGGKVYLVGGSNATEADLLECFDPVLGTWSTKADMPTGRYGLTVVELDGVLYAIGGYASPDRFPYATVEAYYPASDTWVVKAPMRESRVGFQCVAFEGKIYAIGGKRFWLSTDQQTDGIVECYNPLANTWSFEAAVPHANYGMASAAAGGRIVVSGGFSWAKASGMGDVLPITFVGLYGASALRRLPHRVPRGEVLVAPNVIGTWDSTHIFLSGNAGSTVRVRVFDESGEVVRTLHAQLDGAGKATLRFDGDDYRGAGLQPGAYWVMSDGDGRIGKALLVVTR